MVLAAGVVVLRFALQLMSGWAGPEETFRWFARHASFGDRTVSAAPLAAPPEAGPARLSAPDDHLRLA